MYEESTRRLGRMLAQSGVELVYGGARVGLMGTLADAVLRQGGSAIGVMPRSLVDREIQHTGLTKLHIVESMHERKTKMAALANAFIALPGGAGTLEEIFEQWTWAQLGIHQKPCAFLNINQYFDPLRAMIDRMVADGFLRPDHASMLAFHTDPDTIMESFRSYTAPADKWESPVIPIAAALVLDRSGRVLLVRKKGTTAFMQPGGKLVKLESPLSALERELREELNCSVVPETAALLGTFRAPAANEAGHSVEATLYRVELNGEISIAAEIEEMAWVDPAEPGILELAPLTAEFVLPLARTYRSSIR